MMIRFFSWMILVGSFFVMSGCSGTSGAESRGKTGWNEEGAPILKTNVIFNNRSLAGDVTIIDMTSSRAGDMMMAQVTLKSKEKDTLNLQYKFEWYDLNGIALNTASASWKPLLLYGQESKSIQGVAPDPRGREYKLLLRNAE